jgi:anti-sigma B factor antagonist
MRLPAAHIYEPVVRQYVKPPQPEAHGPCILRSIAGALSRSGTPVFEDGSVTISVRDVGNAKVVEVAGDVNLGTSPELRKTLFDALPLSGRLALNLGAIRYIDSSGIATLVEVLRDSQRLQKEFVLFGLSPKVMQVFRLTHVIRIFRVFDTEQEALGAP